MKYDIYSSNRSLFFGIRLNGFKQTFSQSNGFVHTVLQILYSNQVLGFVKLLLQDVGNSNRTTQCRSNPSLLSSCVSVTDNIDTEPNLI